MNPRVLLRGRPWVLDSLLAAVVLVAGQVEASVNPPDGHAGGSVAAARALAVVLSVPLVLRRSAPAAALCAMTAGTALISLGWPHPLYFWTDFVPLCLGVYAAARLVDGWLGDWSWLVASLAVDLTVLHTPSAREASNIVFSAVVLGACSFAGRLVRRGSRARARLAETLEQLAEEHRRAEDAAVREERRRIAREVQDVVAHAVGSMLVQVGAARLELEATGSVPAQLLAAEETGRRALAELRRSVASGGDPAPASFQPVPDLSRLPELLQGFVDAGLAVEVESADLGTLPADLQASAYRIVQESLTNALRHAGRVPVRVRLARSGDVVEVVVSNPSGSPGGARLPSGGHGLVGLRQRVAVFDGSLEAGSQGEHFVVRAVMRVPDAVPDPAVAAQGAAR